MGKAWDYDVPETDIWMQVHDVLKPGAHLLSFFGSRTYHRGAIPIEDAGFEIRDQLMWLYGSGFPKSHNIGKAADKLQGNEREVVGVSKNEKDFRDLGKNTKEIHGLDKLGVGVSASRKSINITKGNSEWEGWGTALKPAHEPIVMARKPFKGSVAKNVLEHGTGGINIDGSRIEGDSDAKTRVRKAGSEFGQNSGWNDHKNVDTIYDPSQGRYPANVMHDGSEVMQDVFSDKSRYFYCAKASKKDRDEGLENFEEKMMGMSNGAQSHGEDYSPSKTAEHIGLNRVIARKNTHPTVKPTELMRYLCRLVTPKGGVVLDPFMGSGSTGKAAMMSGFKFVGIELNQEYFDIACARLEAVQNNIQGDMFD
jgi:site-specific DNA-methyltransferase (adenine-specific)